MLPATLVMGVSILGLLCLFSVKSWEEKHARIFMPGFRLAADGKALQLKAFLARCEEECRKLGPTSMRIGRMLLHDLALTLAALSRASERGAHRLADMVSHKHRFERRETKSEFLKQVSEFPIRNLRETGSSAPVSEAEKPMPAPETKPMEMPAPVPAVVVKTEPVQTHSTNSNVTVIKGKKGKNGRNAK